MLKLDALTMTYLYGATAFKPLSFVCEKGQSIAVLGGAESGKTSLLKCIAGLYPATEGKAYIDDTDITNKKPKYREVMLVQDDCGILKFSSVRKNLELPLRIRKIPKAERTARVEEVAKKFGIFANLADRGYMLFDDDRLRLAVARTALRHSEVVLFDDVFKCVPSAERQKKFNELLPSIRDLRDSAVLFATTSVDEAFTVGDLVCVLNFGVLQQIGAPEELIAKPATLFVDKLVNPDKNRLKLTVNGTKLRQNIKILNETVYSYDLGDYLNKELICSFALQATAQTDGSPISDYKYKANAVYVTCGGMTALADSLAYRYKLALNKSTINFFDPSTEFLIPAQSDSVNDIPNIER